MAYWPSSIRSASSKTRKWIVRRSWAIPDGSLSMWSASLPGVAIKMCGRRHNSWASNLFWVQNWIFQWFVQFYLCHLVPPTNNNTAFQIDLSSESGELVANLECQFSGWSENERKDAKGVHRKLWFGIIILPGCKWEMCSIILVGGLGVQMPMSFQSQFLHSRAHRILPEFSECNSPAKWVKNKAP